MRTVKGITDFTMLGPPFNDTFEEFAAGLVTNIHTDELTQAGSRANHTDFMPMQRPGLRARLRRAARVIQQCSAEVTHSENGTEIGNEMRTAIIRAEGVLLGGREGQAISSTPKACGARFHYPRRRRAWCR